jgi:protocatechuate 3,4-dioxygenase beta subunit
MELRRREMLAAAMAGAGSLVVGGRALAHSGGVGALKPTPTQTTGPFYPIPEPGDGVLDLTRVGDRRAQGRMIAVEGQARLPDGRPAAGIVVVAWQANAAGRYRHPGDPALAALDPGFPGQGAMLADAQGRFRLLTVRPAAYDTPEVGKRTPHIHWDFIAPRARLVTQSYFPGEAMNANDFVMAEMTRAGGDPAAVTMHAMPADAAGVARYHWDVVLAAA